MPTVKRSSHFPPERLFFATGGDHYVKQLVKTVGLTVMLPAEMDTLTTQLVPHSGLGNRRQRRSILRTRGIEKLLRCGSPIC